MFLTMHLFLTFNLDVMKLLNGSLKDISLDIGSIPVKGKHIVLLTACNFLVNAININVVWFL